jgi:hypothetical protein
MKNVLKIDYSPSGARVYLSGEYNGEPFSFSFVGTGETNAEWAGVVLNKLGVQTDDPTLTFDEVYIEDKLINLYEHDSLTYELEQDIADLRPYKADDLFMVFNELYGNSAMTFEGLTEESIPEAVSYIEEKAGETPKAFIYSGEQMNELFELGGENAYPADLTFVSFVNTGSILAISIGARWFDDIIQNNAYRGGYNPFEDTNVNDQEDDDGDDLDIGGWNDDEDDLDAWLDEQNELADNDDDDFYESANKKNRQESADDFDDGEDLNYNYNSLDYEIRRFKYLYDDTVGNIDYYQNEHTDEGLAIDSSTKTIYKFDLNTDKALRFSKEEIKSFSGFGYILDDIVGNKLEPVSSENSVVLDYIESLKEALLAEFGIDPNDLYAMRAGAYTDNGAFLSMQNIFNIINEVHSDHYWDESIEVADKETFNEKKYMAINSTDIPVIRNWLIKASHEDFVEFFGENAFGHTTFDVSNLTDDEVKYLMEKGIRVINRLRKQQGMGNQDEKSIIRWVYFARQYLNDKGVSTK